MRGAIDLKFTQTHRQTLILSEKIYCLPPPSNRNEKPAEVPLQTRYQAWSKTFLLIL